MAKSAARGSALELSKLREALALSEMRLKEARRELSRIVRITEQDLAQQRFEVEEAQSAAETLKCCVENYTTRVRRLIQMIRDSDLLPPEIIISWLVRSDLFDSQFYLRRNEDVAAAKFDAGEHFLKHGLEEGRDFSDTFGVRL
jgi:hypothetical protein